MIHFCSEAEENTILFPFTIKEKIKFIHILKPYLHFTLRKIFFKLRI